MASVKLGDMTRRGALVAICVSWVLVSAGCNWRWPWQRDAEPVDVPEPAPPVAEAPEDPPPLPPVEPPSPRLTLRGRLEARKAEWARTAPSETVGMIEAEIAALRTSGVLAQAKKVGETAPDFTLDNTVGKKVKLSHMLSYGPVVLSWYRGGWCPYCSIELQALQEALPMLRKFGARVVAITPELQEHALNTARRHRLEFEVVSDVGNKVARQYGLVYVPGELMARHLQRKQKVDLSVVNGDTSGQLPLAATYVIDTGGVIRYAFVHADHRRRAEPIDLVAALEKIKRKPPSK